MITFLVLLVLVSALSAGFLAGAWVMDEYHLRKQRSETVRLQWAGLQATQRMGVAYWQAQQALRTEAEQASGTVTPEQEG